MFISPHTDFIDTHYCLMLGNEKRSYIKYLDFGIDKSLIRQSERLHTCIWYRHEFFLNFLPFTT